MGCTNTREVYILDEKSLPMCHKIYNCSGKEHSVIVESSFASELQDQVHALHNPPSPLTEKIRNQLANSMDVEFNDYQTLCNDTHLKSVRIS